MSITQREFLELSDRINQEVVLIEKFGFYAAQAQDPEVRQVLREIQNSHLWHYELLLREANNTAQGTVQQAIPGTQPYYSNPTYQTRAYQGPQHGYAGHPSSIEGQFRPTPTNYGQTESYGYYPPIRSQTHTQETTTRRYNKGRE